jgi:hypothetical protein
MRGARIVLLLATMVGAAPAQDAGCLRMVAVVSVLDNRGMQVEDLDASNFHIEFRGRSATVEYAVKNTLRRKLMVLLDASETMRETSTGKWQLANLIAQHVLAYGPPASEVRFLTFGKALEPRLKADRTIERPELADRMGQLMSGWFPAIGRGEKRGPLFDFLLEGLKQMEKPEAGDALFVITDGGEESSRARAEQVQQELLRAGVRLFAVTLPMRYEREISVVRPGSGDTPFDEQQENTDFMNTVRVTGGRALRVRPRLSAQGWGYDFSDKEKEALATSLQFLYVQMWNFYRLQITLPEAPHTLSNWKITYEPPDNLRKIPQRIVAPTKVAACAPP